MFRALTTLALVSLFAANPIQAEDKEAGNSPSASFDDIRKKFSPKDNPLDGPGDHPFCEDLFKRKQEENRAIIVSQLTTVAKETGNHDALKAFVAGVYRFPSAAMMKSTEIEGENPPAYFSGETRVEQLLLPREQGEPKYGSITLEKFADASDENSKLYNQFVLSSSRFIMSDPDYQMDCWAPVRGIIGKPLPKGSEVGVMHYQRGKEHRTKLRIALQTQPKFFGATDGKRFEPTVCEDMDLGAVMFTSKMSNESSSKTCRFATLDTMTSELDEPYFNLDVFWTGAYYVGKVEAQVLVKN